MASNFLGGIHVGWMIPRSCSWRSGRYRGGGGRLLALPGGDELLSRFILRRVSMSWRWSAMSVV